MANLKTKAIDSTDMAEIREGACRHKHGTFKSTGEIPQKTECSYESENGLNERAVENDICGLETAVFKQTDNKVPFALPWRMVMKKLRFKVKVTPEQSEQFQKNATKPCNHQKGWKKTMNIKDFCDTHEACAEGREWALENCKNMQEVWQTAKPEWLMWVATRNGVLTEKELRLFAVWSARRVQHLMTDQRSIAALDVAERYAHGNATVDELIAAREAAVRAEEAGAAQAAAIATAKAATGEAAKAAMWAVRAAVRAANAACEAAVWEEARAVQAEYLRTNCKPNFKL